MLLFHRRYMAELDVYTALINMVLYSCQLSTYIDGRFISCEQHQWNDWTTHNINLTTNLQGKEKKQV